MRYQMLSGPYKSNLEGRPAL